jgi:SAM-dependent methyltransferase
MTFLQPGDSHKHSLETLNQLYEYDDFMASISSMVDLGCGNGDDLEWWATRTTRDEVPVPLNIRCTGVDLDAELSLTKKYINLSYQQTDFEDFILPHPGGFDILWCHDAFQYAQNPLATLTKWWHIASPGAMLYICVPITQRIHRRQLDYYLPGGNYYHYSMVNLIYMLATCGWDCRAGFFKQALADSWLHAVVYKSTQEPINPKTVNWHRLSELNLVPASAAASIYAHGHLKQQDLVVPWIDQSLMSMAVK